MNRTMIWGGGAAVAALLGYLALAPTGAEDAGPAALPAGAALAEVRVPDDLPEEVRIGQRVFEASCAECHGENAAGRNGVGPPLVHRIYEPFHHGVGAFLLAVRNGVRAHHWSFGDMPAVEGVTDAEIGHVTRYVRAEGTVAPTACSMCDVFLTFFVSWTTPRSERTESCTEAG